MKKIFLYFLLFIITIRGFSQAPIDLFDPFYEDLAIWENTGLINQLPSIKPYPLQEIERILNIVIAEGTPTQVKRAKEYQSRFFEKKFHFGATGQLGIKIPDTKKDFSFAPFVETNLKLNKWLTGSAYFNVSVMNHLPKEESLPYTQISQRDIVKDQGNIGKLRLLPSFNSSVAIGTPEYYFSAGISRASFGPFAKNNIFIGDQALHSGQFMLVVNKGKFNYNQILFMLSSSDNKGNSLNPDKFLSAHSFKYSPFSWLSLEFIDMMIYGGRFEPMYLLPLSVFFIGQGVYGFPDNSLIGLSFTVKPIDGLKIDGALLIDDLGVNEIIKFKSAKWRLAGQFGISYAMPKDHWFKFVDLNYTMVMPYMYAHVDTDSITDMNHQNFTHNGQSLGSNLQPNSDRIRLKLRFEPVYGFSIDFTNTFIRHGNISESITDGKMLYDYLSKEYTTDGSVFNHATITKKDPITGETSWKDHAFLYSTPFLKQKTIQYVNQMGLDFAVNLPIIRSRGNIQFKAGYVFEANINPGINTNIYAIDTTISGYKKEWKDLTPAEQDEVKNKAKTQLETWRKNALGKQFNHYFSISVKFTY